MNGPGPLASIGRSWRCLLGLLPVSHPVASMTEWACEWSGCDSNLVETFAAAMDEAQAHVDETGHSASVGSSLAIMPSF